MPTTVQVTKEAVEHLAARSGLYADDAEELLSELISMCVVTSRLDNGNGAGELVTAAENLLQFREGILSKEYDKLSPTLAGAFHDLSMAIKKTKEGEPSRLQFPKNNPYSA